jgi:hypothetical protein
MTAAVEGDSSLITFWPTSNDSPTTMRPIIGRGDSKSVALPIILDIRETPFGCRLRRRQILFIGVKKVTPAVTFAARCRTELQRNKAITCTVQESNLQPSD